MGILRSREELLPVTCAILGDEDRKSFFSQLQKRGGSTERIARIFSAPAALVQDWISGQANVPYHALQHLSHEFGIDLPQVRELRRESQPVLQIAVKRDMGDFDPRAKPKKEAKPPKPEGRKRKERGGEPRGERTAKRGRGRRGGRGEQRAPKEPRREKQRAPKPARSHQPRRFVKLRRGPDGEPGPSSELAYWVGTLFVGARVEDGRLILSAGRSSGHDYAPIWAKLSEILFGRTAQVTMAEDGSVNEASIEAAPLEGFLSRMVGKAGALPALPRWVWSNQDWKAACVAGLADAGAHLTDAPSLTIDLPGGLVRAAGKILQSFGLRPRIEEHSITLAGADELRDYFQAVGTNNPKFRQWAAPQFGEPAKLWLEHEPETAPEPQAEAGPDAKEEPEPAPVADAPEPAAASRPPSRRPKKTLYRGKPGRR